MDARLCEHSSGMKDLRKSHIKITYYVIGINLLTFNFVRSASGDMKKYQLTEDIAQDLKILDD